MTKKRNTPKKNPALKKLTKGTGWMNATAVKIRRNKGKVEVLIRRAKPKRRKPNPAKKKLPVKRYPAYKRKAKRVPAKRKTARKRR